MHGNSHTAFHKCLPYALKQVDFDSRSTYSPVRIVNFINDDILLIHNNPSNGTPIIIRTSELNSTLSIFDEAGRKIKDLVIVNTSMSIPVEQMTTGTYLLVLHKEGRVKITKKFIVHH